MPRGRAGKKKNCQTDPLEFYRTQRWEPFVDEMVTQLISRFPEDHPAFKLQEILPPHIKEFKSETKEELAAKKKAFDDISQAAEVYEKDFPSFHLFRDELIWYQKMLRQEPKDPKHSFTIKKRTC